jgi:hypothetical protein
MGRLVPKVLLRWQEPVSVRQARESGEDNRLPHRPLLKLGLGRALMTLVAWAVTSLDPKKPPLPWPEALLLAVGAGFFIGYVVPLMAWLFYRWSPSEVAVTEAGISWVVGPMRRFWKYRDVPSCRIASADPETPGVGVLELRGPAGQTIILGIAPAVSLEELGRVLGACGVWVEGPAPAAPAWPPGA